MTEGGVPVQGAPPSVTTTGTCPAALIGTVDRGSVPQPGLPTSHLVVRLLRGHPGPGSSPASSRSSGPRTRLASSTAVECQALGGLPGPGESWRRGELRSSGRAASGCGRRARGAAPGRTEEGRRGSTLSTSVERDAAGVSCRGDERSNGLGPAMTRGRERRVGCPPLRAHWWLPTGRRRAAEGHTGVDTRTPGRPRGDSTRSARAGRRKIVGNLFAMGGH